MKFILTAGWDDGVADLAERITKELTAGKRVLWLVCGGSNIPAAVKVMDDIPADLSKGLSITLTDERYGKPGHPDSNWEQLAQAGFDGKQARMMPVLTGAGLEDTVKAYGELAAQAFDDNDVVIAQLGIGADCHIAGILPDSPAATERTALTAGYQAPPLTRMTMTFPALRRITAAYAFAFGGPKREALESLLAGSQDLKRQPAQILNELAEAYMYNDQVENHG